MKKDLSKFSCMDCKASTCNEKDMPWPAFCLTKNNDEEFFSECMELYKDEENRRVMKAAADVECEGYCKWPRALEIVEFAKRIGANKIGIATCVGLLNEAQTLMW